MMNAFWKNWKIAAIAAAGLAMAAGTPAAAQVETFDPDAAFTGAIDADLTEGAETAVSNTADAAQATANEAVAEASDPFAEAMITYNGEPAQAAQSVGTDVVSAAGADVTPVDPATGLPVNDPVTYGEDDLIGAAEGVFGKGAEGVAKMIQGLLKEQGEPNAYIVGREAGGAFIIGARYGSGTLHHKIEGQRKVYWTGPSIGLDAGANAGNTFVLVYNLFDTEDIYKRFPAGEGQAYLIGGLHASYVRRGDIVMIPVRVGAGVRLGVNAGYMKFSKKQRWLPF
ncbi:MAG: DUF1134 domain-containing protein [Erythrobacter sp.]